MGRRIFLIGLRGGGGWVLRSTALDKSIPSFRHSGRSDKNQCRGARVVMVWKFSHRLIDLLSHRL